MTFAPISFFLSTLMRINNYYHFRWSTHNRSTRRKLTRLKPFRFHCIWKKCSALVWPISYNTYQCHRYSTCQNCFIHVLLLIGGLSNWFLLDGALSQAIKIIFQPGYIDVGTGRWRQNMLVTMIRCGNGFDHIGRRHALSFYISVGHQHSKMSPTSKFSP